MDSALQPHQVERLNQSLVAIFDIEKISIGEVARQVDLVSSFIDKLHEGLALLEIPEPDAFSTGDGAIVSVGRQGQIDHKTLEGFFSFVVEFVTDMSRERMKLRTAINYSALQDRVILLNASDAIQGRWIQVGSTINTAQRILSVCEPGEIMINNKVHDILSGAGLTDKFRFLENEAIVTKHGEELKTYSFDPPLDSPLLLCYDPNSAVHRYKKFNYFPPITAGILEDFRQKGLDFEMYRVVSSAHETVKQISQTKKLRSQDDILHVLMQLPYNPEDSVYVFSREDRQHRFWTQPRRMQYLEHLRNRAGFHGGDRCVNQTRVRVFRSRNDLGTSWGADPMEGQLHDQLVALHRPNTLLGFPADCLFAARYPSLSRLIFGATISKTYKYAVIPVSTLGASGELIPDEASIDQMLELGQDYDPTHGPLRALISIDEEYVDRLISEFESLVKDANAWRIQG